MFLSSIPLNPVDFCQNDCANILSIGIKKELKRVARRSLFKEMDVRRKRERREG